MNPLQPFVPALTQLARFPGSTLEGVARTRGVPLDKLTRIVDLHFGGGVAGLTEPRLAAFLEEHALQAANPNTTLTMDQRERHDLPPEKPSADDREAAADQTRWNSLKFQRGAIEKYVPILEEIASTSWGHAYDKIVRNQYTGITYSAWTAFKLKVFLSGSVEPRRAEHFLQWARSCGRGGKLEVKPVEQWEPAPGGYRMVIEKKPEATQAAAPAPVSISSTSNEVKKMDIPTAPPPKPATAVVTVRSNPDGNDRPPPSAPKIPDIFAAPAEKRIRPTDPKTFAEKIAREDFVSALLRLSDIAEIARQAFNAGDYLTAYGSMDLARGICDRARDSAWNIEHQKSTDELLPAVAV